MEKKCPFCGTSMELKRRSLNKSSPRHKPNPKDPTIYAIDKLYKCSSCHFVATFGVPINPGEYDKVLEKWRGYRIEDYALLEEEDDDIVRDRLRKLGYLLPND